MRELPDGWAQTTLAEIGEWRGGGTPSKGEWRYWDGGSIPWVSPKDMKCDPIDDAEDHITDAAVEGSATQLIPSHSVLLVTRSGILRHSLPVAVNSREVAINQDIKAVTPFQGIEASFVAKQLNAEASAILAKCAKSGTTVDSVDYEKLKAYSFKLAPSNEQRRIVAKLDGLLGRTAGARKELDRIPVLVARYKQAILASAFSGDATREWRERRSLPLPRSGHLAELVAIPVRNGLSIRGSDQPPGVRALRLSALRSHVVDLTDVRFLPIDEQRASRYLLEDGDVLVSRGNGTKALVGLASLVVAPEQPTIFPDTAFRIRLDKRQALAAWFTLIWNAPQTREQIESAAKTTAGIWKVSQGDLTTIRLLIPSIEEQEEIVRRMEAAFAWLNKLAAEHARASALLPKLEQGLLAKAFRGKLVPQDPSDEPASVLLERIRAARAAAPERKRKVRSQLPRAPRQRAAMTKSRLDQDVIHQPYLAKHLRDAGGSARVEDLFRSADLPVTDFYKQLAWEVEAGHINDRGALLEAA